VAVRSGALASLVVIQARLTGHGDRSGSVLHLEFGEDVGDVIGDGLRAEAEAAGDLDVALSAGDEQEDLSSPGKRNVWNCLPSRSTPR
jgi:hypothetical protein